MGAADVSALPRSAKIYVSGHRGMVGSALVRRLQGGGYHNLLITLADPKHPEHETMSDWVGGAWDAAEFDLDEINAGLRRLKA